MMLLTPDKFLPGSISIDTKEQGGHSGNTTVLAHLIVETSIAGNITVEKAGKMTVKGEITGDVINHGELIVESSAKIVGDLQNYGTLTLQGSISQGTLGLKTGSHAYIDSTQMSQIKTISSEPNAFVEMKSGGGFNVSE